MKKKHEIADRDSCLNRADDDEQLFVLLGRDLSTPDTIRFWCQDRVSRKLNTANDHQIREALVTAQLIEDEQREQRAKAPRPKYEYNLPR